MHRVQSSTARRGARRMRKTTYVREAATDGQSRPLANDLATPPTMRKEPVANTPTAKGLNPVSRTPASPPQQVVQQISRDGISARLGYAYDREVARGLRILLLACCVAGTLAWFVPLSGAVAMLGTLVSGSNAQKIQHPAGGVIDQILVTDGAHAAGRTERLPFAVLCRSHSRQSSPAAPCASGPFRRARRQGVQLSAPASRLRPRFARRRRQL